MIPASFKEAEAFGFQTPEEMKLDLGPALWNLPNFNKVQGNIDNLLLKAGTDHRVFFITFRTPYLEKSFWQQWQAGGGILNKFSPYCQSILLFQKSGAHFPVFELRPRRFLDRVAKGIVFPDHPIFSNKYYLRGPQYETVRPLFSSPVFDYLERDTSKWRIEGGGGDVLMFYRLREVVENDHFGEFVRSATKIFQLLMADGLS